jgi:hypothetical protein
VRGEGQLDYTAAMRSPRLSPLPPDLALELSPSSVEELLARFAPNTVTLDAGDPLSVAEALSYRLVSARFARALADVTRLATPVGYAALLELLAGSLAPGRALPSVSAVDLAARVVCGRGLKKSVARSIVKRALIRVARHFAPRPWRTLVWPKRSMPERLGAIVDAGRAVHGAAFVRGWIASCEGGVARVTVVYEGPPERIVTRDGGHARARTVRRLACDVVRWDSRDGRVSFSLARPEMLAEWASAIAATVGDGAESFADQPAYTFKMLHERGAAWLAAVPLPAGVKNLRVVACEVDDGKRVRVRSDAALADVHEATGRARGYARLVTIRFDVAGHSEPVDVTIELPWKVTLSDARFEEEARRVMDALAMHEPGRIPDDVPSLAPAQSEWRWADLVGAEAFARAVERRTLARVRGRHPSGREHRRWGTLLRAFDVPGEDAAYVVGEDVAIRAFDARPEALVWYAIDWSRAAEALRGQMGFAPVRVTGAPEGFVPIGEIGPAGKTVIALLVTRAVAESEVVGLLRQLRHACGRATPVLVVARGRSLGGALAEVEVEPAEQLGVGDAAWVGAKIAEQHGCDDDIEPRRHATEDAPLVLSVKRGEAWYRSVKLLLTDNQLAILFALARAKGWMKSVDLGRKVAPGAELPDQIVRKARMNLQKRLERSFREAGEEMPAGLADELVRWDRVQGYRLGVGAVVV